jgi:hypothetical protein
MLQQIVRILLLCCLSPVLGCADTSARQETQAQDSYCDTTTGRAALVPDWSWVEVVNEHGLDNGNGHFSYGSTCGIQAGGCLSIIGEEGEMLMVRYSIPGQMFGTPCPSGTEFLLTRDTFNAMTPNYKERLRKEREKAALIERLRTKSPSRGQP